jgi:hypothetical protein
MPPTGNLRKQLSALKKLSQNEYNLFLNQSSGRGRNRAPFTYRQQIANLEKKLKAAIGPRTGLAKELNNARKSLANMKTNVEKTKIKLKVAPEMYRSMYYHGAYGPPTALKINFFNSLPKNKRNIVEKRLKNALNAHNKKIANAEARVKTIENQAARHAGALMARTPVVQRMLYAPTTGMAYARAANTWPGGVNLPKTATELAAMLRRAERMGANRARGRA